MTYYDHATAMAYKLDAWSDERTPRNFELELLDRERCASIAESNSGITRWSTFRQYLAFLRSSKLSTSRSST